jgi:hypothetical protein
LFDSHDFEDLEAYLRVFVRRANVLVEEVCTLGQTVNRWAGIIKLLDPEHLEDIRNRLAAREENLECVRLSWLPQDRHVPEGQGQQEGPPPPSQIPSDPMITLSAKVQSLESQVDQLIARMASTSP